MKYSRAFCVLVMFGLSSSCERYAFATPTRHTWLRVTPLGINEDCYFYLQMEQRNPGNYYTRTESLSLIRRDIRTARLLERIIFRETEYFDYEANGVWQSRQLPVAPFNLGEYLDRHQVQMVFPGSVPEGLSLIDDRLMERLSKDRIVERVSREAIREPLNDLIPEFGPYKDESGFRIRSACEVAGPGGLDLQKGCLLVLETGEAEFESNFCQHVVFVSGG